MTAVGHGLPGHITVNWEAPTAECGACGANLDMTVESGTGEEERMAHAGEAVGEFVALHAVHAKNGRPIGLTWYGCLTKAARAALGDAQRVGLDRPVTATHHVCYSE